MGSRLHWLIELDLERLKSIGFNGNRNEYLWLTKWNSSDRERLSETGRGPHWSRRLKQRYRCVDGRVDVMNFGSASGCDES